MRLPPQCAEPRVSESASAALLTWHCCDTRQHGLSGVQVLGPSIAVQLVLQGVLDLRLEVLGDVIPAGRQ